MALQVKGRGDSKTGEILEMLMHYYQFHIGDYAGHTQHLDEIEDLAYRRMLDFLYLNEIPLPESIDEIARLIRMRTHCERIAVVLREFFTQLENGEWVNKRVSDELYKIHTKSEKAQESARKRWEKHHANASETHNGRNAIQEPRTKNQEPVIKDCASAKAVAVRKSKKQDGRELLNAVEGLTQQAADDYIKARKNKKAGELTRSALDLIASQASIADLTLADAISFAASKNWAGFKAAWYEKEMTESGKQSKPDFIDRHTDKSWRSE